MSCLDIQEAPGRQAVGSVQAGRQQEEQESIMEVSLQKTGKILPFFLFYEEEKAGGDEKEGIERTGGSFTCRLQESCFCVILKRADGIVRL
mgnify:CR=1 FL=1